MLYYITQTPISRASHWLAITLVRPRRISDHAIVQCFALRNANIGNDRFHLTKGIYNGNVNITR